MVLVKRARDFAIARWDGAGGGLSREGRRITNGNGQAKGRKVALPPHFAPSLLHIAREMRCIGDNGAIHRWQSRDLVISRIFREDATSLPAASIKRQMNVLRIAREAE